MLSLLQKALPRSARRKLANALNVGGFTVTFSCNVTPCSFNGVPTNVYTVALTASRGAYGTPDFVRRAVSVCTTS